MNVKLKLVKQIFLIASASLIVGLSVDFLVSSPLGRFRPLDQLTSTQSILSTVLVVAILYIFRPFFGFPPSILSFGVGYVFDLWVGLAIAILGTVLTALPAFLLGKSSRRLPEWIPLATQLTTASENLIARVGVYRGFAAVSLSPAPLDPVSYAAGITGITFRQFITATLIGAVPWAGYYVFLGASADQIVSGENIELPIFAIIAGTGIAILLLARPAFDWLKSEKQQRKQSYSRTGK